MSALTLVKPQEVAIPAASMTLAQMCEELACLLDTAAMVAEGSAERAELDAQIAQFQATLPTKVESTHYALSYLESQEALLAQEIDRLKKLKDGVIRDREWLESYVVAVIEKQTPDKKGRRTLKSPTVTLSLRPADRVVLPEDESGIADDYKRATIQMPATAWRGIQAEHPDLAALATKTTIAVEPASVKAALREGVEIPGCDIAYVNHLRRT